MVNNDICGDLEILRSGRSTDDVHLVSSVRIMHPKGAAEADGDQRLPLAHHYARVIAPGSALTSKKPALTMVSALQSLGRAAKRCPDF